MPFTNYKRFYQVNNTLCVLLLLVIISKFIIGFAFPLWLAYAILPPFFISSIYFNKWAWYFAKQKKYEYLILQKEHKEKNNL